MRKQKHYEMVYWFVGLVEICRREIIFIKHAKESPSYDIKP